MSPASTTLPDANDNTSAPRTITRRTLARTAAWGTPVILTSVVTPAFASSTPVPPTPTLTLSAPAVIAPADRITVTARLTTDGITPLSGVSVTLAVPSGIAIVGARVVSTNASGQAAFTVLSNGTVGTFRVTATTTSPALSAVTSVTVAGSSIFTSTGGKAFVNQNILIGEVAQVAVGGNYWVILGADGVVHRGNSAGTWTSIPGPALGIKSMAVYAPDGDWVIGAGHDGYGYGSYRGGAFVRIPGASSIEQVSVSSSYWIARDAEGTVYATTVSTSPWQAISAPVAAQTIHAWYGGGQYIMMLGADGRVYNSVGRKPFTLQSDSGANLTFAEIDSGTGWGIGRTTSGAVYRFSSSSWNAWQRIPSPVAMKQIAVYEADGAWVHALGVDGLGYWSYNGSEFTVIPGTSGITKISLAANMWSALTHDGDYYLAPSGKPYALVSGAAGIEDFATYEFGGSYTIAVAPR